MAGLRRLASLRLGTLPQGHPCCCRLRRRLRAGALRQRHRCRVQRRVQRLAAGLRLRRVGVRVAARHAPVAGRGGVVGATACGWCVLRAASSHVSARTSSPARHDLVCISLLHSWSIRLTFRAWQCHTRQFLHEAASLAIAKGTACSVQCFSWCRKHRSTGAVATGAQRGSVAVQGPTPWCCASDAFAARCWSCTGGPRGPWHWPHRCASSTPLYTKPSTQNDTQKSRGCLGIIQHVTRVPEV